MTLAENLIEEPKKSQFLPIHTLKLFKIVDFSCCSCALSMLLSVIFFIVIVLVVIAVACYFGLYEPEKGSELDHVVNTIHDIAGKAKDKVTNWELFYRVRCTTIFHITTELFLALSFIEYYMDYYYWNVLSVYFLIQITIYTII